MRYIVLVARPTPAGVDGRFLAALAAAVAERAGQRVHVAHLDQEDPSVAAVLDEIAVDAGRDDDVVLVPLALPADPYLRNWAARAAAHWTESRGADLLVWLSPPPSTAPGMAEVLAGLALGEATPVAVSRAAFRSPAWSVATIPCATCWSAAARAAPSTGRATPTTHL